MTEKRYSKMMNHYGTSRTYCTGIYDNQNNRELQNNNQVITELNALHKENELLQKTLDDTVELLNKKLIDNPDYCNLMKTNQEQKETIKRLQAEIERLKKNREWRELE